ncbi:hypothetical protein, partial [Microcoleus sp. herbarium12]|uniref:hypothetical protein n=1 Tax=Microcoleus sp. herbarium12 TaxID=3055437 RepID=UPI002FD7244C
VEVALKLSTVNCQLSTVECLSLRNYQNLTAQQPQKLPERIQFSAEKIGLKSLIFREELKKMIHYSHPLPSASSFVNCQLNELA